MFGSGPCIPLPYSTAMENRGNGAIPKWMLEWSHHRRWGEGWLDRLWKLGFLGSGNFLALVVLPEDMRCIESAAGRVTSMARCIGWLGVGQELRVVIPRGVLPRLEGLGKGRLLGRTRGGVF